MQDEMIMYVRNRKSEPIGATYFARTNIDFKGTPVIAMGWSKAYKTDTFTKKFGRSIAIKRAIKGFNWLTKRALAGESITEEAVFLCDDEFITNKNNIPFAIKQNLSYYIDAAKDSFGIESGAFIVIPVIEKLTDLVPAFKDAITNDNDFVDHRKAKVTTKTRYIILQY